MQDEQYAEICQALPVFPLPRTVLLPGSTLPLHVFEPRYRALVEHCKSGPGYMGIATLKPGYEADYEGNPVLFPEVGVGQMVAHQPYPDGRSNIAVRYVCRMRIDEELETDELFRIVRGPVLPEEPEGAEGALRSLRVLVLQLGGLSTGAAEEARRLVQLQGMELADALARRVLESVEAKMEYLRADRWIDRVDLVQEWLARFMTTTAPTGEA